MKAYLFLALCCTTTIATPCLAADGVSISVVFDDWSDSDLYDKVTIFTPDKREHTITVNQTKINKIFSIDEYYEGLEDHDTFQYEIHNLYSLTPAGTCEGSIKRHDGKGTLEAVQMSFTKSADFAGKGPWFKCKLIQVYTSQ